MMKTNGNESELPAGVLKADAGIDGQQE